MAKESLTKQYCIYHLSFVILIFKEYVFHSLNRTESVAKTKFIIFMRLRVVLLLFLLLDDCCAGNNSSQGIEKRKSDHRMALAWAFNPMFGLIGTCLNSFILYMFYTERHTFIRPINAMIW